jgi:hypothetical protein
MKAYAKKSGDGTRRITVSASEDAVTVTRSGGPWSPGGAFPAADPGAVARAIAADLEEDGYTEERP